MKPILSLIACIYLLNSATSTRAADPTTQPATKPTDFHGFEQIKFTFINRACVLVKPKTPATGNPWAWRAEFFGHEPQTDIALLNQGWHIAYINVSNMYGCPASIDAMKKFHDELVDHYQLNPKAVLIGMSRGGLYSVNFALAHPDNVSCLYLDAPVLNLNSWPGGKDKGKGAPKEWKECLQIYGLTEITINDFKGSPLDQVENLAKSKIPIISVCGDADDTVPFNENTLPFSKRYEAAGGEIKVITKPGVNHHPHSLKDPTPIVDFILTHSNTEK